MNLEKLTSASESEYVTLVFWVWFTSPSLFSNFIHLSINFMIFFLQINSISLCMYTTFLLSIHLLMII